MSTFIPPVLFPGSIITLPFSSVVPLAIMFPLPSVTFTGTFGTGFPFSSVMVMFILLSSVMVMLVCGFSGMIIIGVLFCWPLFLGMSTFTPPVLFPTLMTTLPFSSVVPFPIMFPLLSVMFTGTFGTPVPFSLVMVMFIFPSSVMVMLVCGFSGMITTGVLFC